MDTRVRQQELKVLYDITQIIGRALNLDETLDVILGILSDNLAMKRATVTLRQGEKGRLVIRAAHGLSFEEKKRGVYGTDEGITGRIFKSAEPVVVPDISSEPLFLNKTGSRDPLAGTISFIGVPILLHRAPVGVLSVDRLFDEGVSFDEDVRFLTILGGLIAQIVSLNMQVREREGDLLRANTSLKAEISEKAKNFFAMSTSPAMTNVHGLIRKVAATKATVLLLGESGTGKTLVARIIHELSPRSRFPFVKVNCAALPDTLLESELFGHERGAFTGATESKIGRVEEAHRGTLFLDEIAELTLPLQAKLLRFLQEKEFERLGSTKTREVDVRIVAATNQELSAAVAAERFRADLFYRLNVFPIRVPALRERQEDIRPLLNFFREKSVREYGRGMQFAPDAVEALARYMWPGNVREMENLVERLIIIADGDVVDARQLSAYLGGIECPEPSKEGPGVAPLKEMERRSVLAALERSQWIQVRAAKELGITLRQMGYKIKKLGIEDLVKRMRSGPEVS